jgi:hypothetical protein
LNQARKGDVLRRSNLGLIATRRSALSSSVRLRWESVAGSEIFAVYSDGRNTRDSARQGLLNRSIAIKARRLVRF